MPSPIFAHFAKAERGHSAERSQFVSPQPAAMLRTSWLLIAGALSLTASCGGGSSSSALTKVSRGPSVGPATGTVMVVGGGAQGPDIFARFIQAAGGPDALIVEVPTAGDDSIDVATVGRGLRAAGAKNLVVYHTTNRAVADADTFVAKIANARGVWFGGGRHYRLVNSYAGTKSERAFQAVLDRGGIVGGSSAGASILASYLVRGAPSNDNRIMNHPQYLKGFGYLRGVAIDQHVVARERLPDLFDSLTSRRPDLLGISEDEGTVWLVRGDTAEIVGRNKAFVYNGRDATDKGKPFLTLHPGDRYNLAARRVMSRAIDATPLTQKFVDNLFATYRDTTKGGATVLVAVDGKVLIDAAYGIAPQRRFMPETAVPNVALRDLGAVLDASLTRESNGRVAPAALQRALSVGGMQRVRFDTVTKLWSGNVDDLYRFEQGRSTLQPGMRDTSVTVRGMVTDTVFGLRHQAAYGVSGGRRAAWARYPERRGTIIILTNDDAADVRSMETRIAEKLFGKGAR